MSKKYTIAQAAEVLEISEGRVKSKLKQGDFPHAIDGIIPERDINAHLRGEIPVHRHKKKQKNN